MNLRAQDTSNSDYDLRMGEMQHEPDYILIVLDSTVPDFAMYSKVLSNTAKMISMPNNKTKYLRITFPLGFRTIEQRLWIRLGVPEVYYIKRTNG